jgi:hypothetical protein
MIMNEQVFDNYIDEVTRVAESVSGPGSSVEYNGYLYLQATLFHMAHRVPGVAEYLEKELERLTELNTLGRI